jgi:hypothetical protein
LESTKVSRRSEFGCRLLILVWGRLTFWSLWKVLVSLGWRWGSDFLRDLCSCLDIRSIWSGILRQVGLLELSYLNMRFVCLCFSWGRSENCSARIMELFPQSASLVAVQDAAAHDATRYLTMLHSSPLFSALRASSARWSHSILIEVIWLD